MSKAKSDSINAQENENQGRVIPLRHVPTETSEAPKPRPAPSMAEFLGFAEKLIRQEMAATPHGMGEPTPAASRVSSLEALQTRIEQASKTQTTAEEKLADVQPFPARATNADRSSERKS